MPISLDKIRSAAPALVPLAKSAAVALTNAGLPDGFRASVYLVLDHSGSMIQHYADGAVQRLADQALALSAAVDDDGTVPVIFFGSTASPAREVRLADHAGAVARLSAAEMWGSTDYEAAIRAVSRHYLNSPAYQRGVPALVIFQTDGNPDDYGRAEDALAEVSKLPMFFAFVGFGHRMEFLAQLDQLAGRVVDNASFFPADRPLATSDESLYWGILHEVPSWLSAARAAGIL